MVGESHVIDVIQASRLFKVILSDFLFVNEVFNFLFGSSFGSFCSVVTGDSVDTTLPVALPVDADSIACCDASRRHYLPPPLSGYGPPTKLCLTGSAIVVEPVVVAVAAACLLHWRSLVLTGLSLLLISLLVLLWCHVFQGRSASIGISMKKSVVGSGFGVYTCSPSATVRFLWRTVWRCGPSWRASRVRRGACCRAGAVVNLSQSVHAFHVMWNPFVNNETSNQLDVRNTENTHISLLQIL